MACSRQVKNGGVAGWLASGLGLVGHMYTSTLSSWLSRALHRIPSLTRSLTRPLGVNDHATTLVRIASVSPLAACVGWLRPR